MKQEQECRQMDDITSLVVAALAAAKKAGDAILDVYHSEFVVEHKNDKSPLTVADRRAHGILVQHLSVVCSRRFHVLSEEGNEIPYTSRKEWKEFWLVDPLDGTKEFVSRNGEFTVNIALVFKESPVLGVIYIPVTDVFYFGVKGQGAYKLEPGDAAVFFSETGPARKNLYDRIVRKSFKLPIHYGKTHSRLRVIASRSHRSSETEDFMAKLRQKYGEIEIISAGSSLKICRIAEGLADVYPRFGPTMEWDTAAGQVIAEEAGGSLCDIVNKKPLRYNKESLLNPFFIVTNSSSTELF